MLLRGRGQHLPVMHSTVLRTVRTLRILTSLAPLSLAMLHSHTPQIGKAVTLNNLACYYRRRGKLHASLQHLQRALKIEARLGSKVRKCSLILAYAHDHQVLD